MCAVGVHGMYLILVLKEEHLSTFNALNLTLLLLTILEVYACQALELEFGSHVADACGESCSVDNREVAGDS